MRCALPLEMILFPESRCLGADPVLGMLACVNARHQRTRVWMAFAGYWRWHLTIQRVSVIRSAGAMDSR